MDFSKYYKELSEASRMKNEVAIFKELQEELALCKGGKELNNR